MYKIRPEDIRFTQWEDDVTGDYVVTQAILFLADDTSHESVGTNRSINVHKNASIVLKKQALEFARDHLLDTFDLIESAKNLNFKGSLDKLEVSSLPNVFTIEEMIRGLE